MRTKILPAPYLSTQEGSNCGLYALAAAARVLDPETHRLLFPTVMECAQSNFKRDTPGVTILRQKAKDLNITQIGEIFSSQDMVRLANAIGLKATIVQNKNWAAAIPGSIDQNRYVLAPFGVDEDTGQPQSAGTDAHWCIIFGYKKPDMMRYAENSPYLTKVLEDKFVVYTKHWDSRVRIFSVRSLRESSENLKAYDAVWIKTKERRDSTMSDYAEQRPLTAAPTSPTPLGGATLASHVSLPKIPSVHLSPFDLPITPMRSLGDVDDEPANEIELPESAIDTPRNTRSLSGLSNYRINIRSLRLSFGQNTMGSQDSLYHPQNSYGIHRDDEEDDMISHTDAHDLDETRPPAAQTPANQEPPANLHIQGDLPATLAGQLVEVWV